MKTLLKVVATMALVGAMAVGGSAAEYKGKYCEGKGDVQFLKLIDSSFGFFHPNPDTQNISMLYVADWDGLTEGISWMMWWIQNSYGPSYCISPFLQEPWRTALYHSNDFWFDQQGDGKSKDAFDSLRPKGVEELIAPDGCLVDAAGPGGAYHRQGDTQWWIHDWAFEFTAAGVVLQSELLLVDRDMAAIKHYLTHLERACNFIETARDPKTNLFLVGPGANLLAPSYGGIKQPDGAFGKGYLAGMSVNYIAALDRMIELYKLTGDKSKQALYETRRKTTKESLHQLVTDKGYFIKSMETNGTKHGVLGQEKYGYFDGVVNADAMAFRVADQAQAEKIYWQIASVPELRPHDLLITNYPSLDDTYDYWDTRETGGLMEYGRWVNGGVWTTVEARALMAYYRLGKFEDVRKSALAAMKFTDNFQMDAPLTKFGSDVWFTDKLTNFCYDALGVPAGTVRGLFEYIYKADSLILYPHVPSTISEYSQKEPVRFGEKRILLSIKNGGPRVKSLRVNGADWKVNAVDCVALPYDALPKLANVEIEMTGGWPPRTVKASSADQSKPAFKPADLPEPMAKALGIVAAMQKAIAKEPGADYERTFLSEIVQAFDAYRERAARDAAGEYSRFKPEKRAEILKLYEDAAMGAYKGFSNVMKRYSTGSDAPKKKIGETFAKLSAGNK